MLKSLRGKIADWFEVLAPSVTDNKIKPISKELMKKIQAIQVKTNFLVNSVMMGEYVSAFKGRGMEFSEVREYVPGDDVRLIDWNVTARMGHPFVKGFQEERELTVILMVDVSSSGEFGSANQLKHEAAAEIASFLAFSAIKNNDKVGLIVFSDDIEHTIPPKKGKSHIWNVIRTILNFSPEGLKTDLNIPLEYLLNVQKHRSVTFLISDFQARDYEKTLKLANQKHDIIAILVSDPREINLPENAGLIHFEDAETGDTVLVDSYDQELRKQFNNIKENERVKLKEFFNANGIDLIEIWTHRSLVDPIVRFFKMREKKH